jgi:hypothetical protein
MAEEPPDHATVFDLRTYALRPGTGGAFHSIVDQGSVPMLRREGIEVVAYGPSLHDQDRYFLLRSFPSLDRRQEQLEAFYSSREWLDHYSERVTSMIDAYHVVVISVAALGRRRPPSAAGA